MFDQPRIYTLPPEGTPEVGKFFWAKFEIAKKEKDRLKINDKMLRNHELVRGKHFKNQSMNKKYPLIPVNLFHTAWTLTKANLTDNRPKFDILPHNAMTEDKAPIMSAAADAWWSRTKQQSRLSDSVGNSEKYGTTIEEIIFDRDMEPPIGDVDTKVIDPFKFFPWPGVREIQKMSYLFVVEIMELADIVRLWPETGINVKTEREWSSLTGKEREEVKAGTLANSVSKSDGNLPANFVIANTAYDADKLDKAMVTICWCKDYTMIENDIEQPVLDEFGQQIIDPMTGFPAVQIIKNSVPKYPGYIRCVYTANQGNVVLSDIPNPSINPSLPVEQTSQTYLFDKYPFVSNNSYTDETNFWGYSFIEQVEILVMHINKLLSMIVAFVEKAVKPALIVPLNCGVELEDLNNKPNLIIRPNSVPAAQTIRYLQGANLPSDIFNTLEILLRLVDTVTGIHDVSEGRKPAGIQAASAIMALQEKAETGNREKVRSYDLLVEERGRMWISMVQNWYTENRTLQLSGLLAEQQGKYVDFRGSDMTGEFSFEVASGSTMPKSKYVQREQSMQLYQQRAIDQVALLNDFEYPHREEIVQRMMQGPLGQALDRLAKAGMPPEILQSVQTVLSMDDKTFKKTFEQQPIPVSGTMAQGGQGNS